LDTPDYAPKALYRKSGPKMDSEDGQAYEAIKRAILAVLQLK
jgi:hypothetical protein